MSINNGSNPAPDNNSSENINPSLAHNHTMQHGLKPNQPQMHPMVNVMPSPQQQQFMASNGTMVPAGSPNFHHYTGARPPHHPIIQPNQNNMQMPPPPPNQNNMPPPPPGQRSLPHPGKIQKQVKLGEKTSKGLRHFSKKVCDLVRAKGVTTYSYVAEYLVEEFKRSGNPDAQDNSAHSNIKRRVYDALNVLMSLNIIKKGRREITWVGLPSNSVQEYNRLQAELNSLTASAREKLGEVHELIQQQVTLLSLVNYNKEMERLGVHNFQAVHLNKNNEEYLRLPFLAVSAEQDCRIQCEVSSGLDEYHFTFDKEFEILDDVQIMTRIGMACNLEDVELTEEELDECLKYVPKNIYTFVRSMCRQNSEQFVHSVLSSAQYLDQGLAQFYQALNEAKRAIVQRAMANVRR